MTDLAGNADGRTPLDEDELRGLRLSYVTNRGELDAAEQLNIVDGRRWATTRRLQTVDGILDDVFVRDLHHRMFGDVWKWAGKYRTTDKNIGIDPRDVPVSVRNLCEDAKLWCAAAAIDAQRDVAAVQVHQRLALIHPFVNGNGRHARLMADLLIVAMGGTPFSWGGTAAAMPTVDGDPVRADYLDALRKADRGDLPPLVAFARS